MKRPARRRGAVVTACVIALALSACGNPKPPPKATTQRQRDSAIGASGLPGAKGVTRALQVSDSLRAQNARLDSLARQP